VRAEARTNLVDIIGTAEAVPFQDWQGLKPIEFLGIFGASKLVPLLQSPFRQDSSDTA
jgi:hypothetical protein